MVETQGVERFTIVRRKHMTFYLFFSLLNHFFGASLGFSCIWAFGSILAKMGINKVMYRRDENHSHKLKPKSPFGNIMGNEISLSKNMVYKPLIKRAKKQQAFIYNMFNHPVMRKRSKFVQLKNIKLEASPLHTTCLYFNFVAFAATSLAAFALAIQGGFGLVMALQAKIDYLL